MNKAIISDYMKFDPDAFLKAYYSDLQIHPQYGDYVVREDVMRWLHDAFATESPCEREMFLRQKISGICKIDLLQEDPLAPSFFPKFDVITTSLCLISVAEDPAVYEQLARRAADMLVDGGHLVLFSLCGNNRYQVGTSWFRSLVIDVEKVQQIWKHCGFEIISFRQSSSPLPEHYPNMLYYYLMVARKGALI